MNTKTGTKNPRRTALTPISAWDKSQKVLAARLAIVERSGITGDDRHIAINAWRVSGSPLPLKEFAAKVKAKCSVPDDAPTVPASPPTPFEKKQAQVNAAFAEAFSTKKPMTNLEKVRAASPAQVDELYRRLGVQKPGI